MLPMFFDHRILGALPLQDQEGINRIVQVLRTLIGRRVAPYFREKRGVDSTVIARVIGGIKIQRLEDDAGSISLVGLVSKKGREWTIHIHERVFDYLAFVIPSDPEARLGGTTREESKILAFTEFMLRHTMERLLYPEKTEREVIRADIAFAMDSREEDPTFYRMLCNALSDEMNGIEGEPYLALLGAAEEGKPKEYLITRILAPYAQALAEVPSNIFREVFPPLDRDIKTGLLGEYYRRSRDTSYPLVKRAAYLIELLTLFAILTNQREEEARDIFEAFKAHWGLLPLFHELDLPETGMEFREPEELFELFKEQLHKFSVFPGEVLPETASKKSAAGLKPKSEDKPVKSLKDRIEEAKNDLSFPRQVIAVIDKNKVNAVGHSGPKYSEMIETLLAIPWGRINNIRVSPEDFENGLNHSHYGLEKPKEILCDFFTNLIWRYRNAPQEADQLRHRTGSAFLFVGPPGVGKTSLAISIAKNLGIAYHKISLGGMRDEVDLRGHGFTYEGSKPGAIVQGLVKMGIMNGMFIMDEADKTEKFAIATLLEILDPEQNHLFHDRYTETTVDIDLSNCHFILTANTLETVPPAVLNRCEIVTLDRYSVDEKIAIARRHLIKGVRERYGIKKKAIFFDPDQEKEILRFLVKTYTREPGVRELERIIRQLFLRILRKEMLSNASKKVRISREKIKQFLEIPILPRQINKEDRLGEMLALGVDVERGTGSILPVQATPIRLGGEQKPLQRGYSSMVHATGNIKKIMDESRKVATTGILHCADDLGIDLARPDAPVHLHFMGASTPKDGPSAGGAIALALASALNEQKIRRDVAMTGEIDTHGRVTGVGALDLKLETAYAAGCKTMIIPEENLQGKDGIERLPETLKQELQILTYKKWKQEHDAFDYRRHALQVVSVEHIAQAADIAFIREEEIRALEALFVSHGRSTGDVLRNRSDKEAEHCVYALYCKAPEELESGYPDKRFQKICRHYFLLRKGLEDEDLKRLSQKRQDTRIVDFDPSRETLCSVIEEIEKTSLEEAITPCSVSVSAPFFFFKRDGIRLNDFKSLRLFANNYTTHGVKIKTSKPLLNRVYGYLGGLDTELLNACPFLSREKDIIVVDLAFIPEKYRLDIARAEKILRSCLGQWLKAVEDITRTA